MELLTLERLQTPDDIGVLRDQVADLAATPLDEEWDGMSQRCDQIYEIVSDPRVANNLEDMGPDHETLALVNDLFRIAGFQSA